MPNNVPADVTGSSYHKHAHFIGPGKGAWPGKDPKASRNSYTAPPEDAGHPVFKDYADGDVRDRVTALPPSLLAHYQKVLEDGMPGRRGLEMYFHQTSGLKEQMASCPETLDCLDGINKHAFDLIDQGMHDAGVLQTPITVWRRLALTPEHKKKLYVFFEQAMSADGEVRMPSFKGASIDIHGYHGDFDFVYEIRARTGIWIGTLSPKQSEAEFLLRHDARFKVKGIKTVKFRSPAGYGAFDQMVVQLEELVQ